MKGPHLFFSEAHPIWHSGRSRLEGLSSLDQRCCKCKKSQREPRLAHKPLKPLFSQKDREKVSGRRRLLVEMRQRSKNSASTLQPRVFFVLLLLSCFPFLLCSLAPLAFCSANRPSTKKLDLPSRWVRCTSVSQKFFFFSHFNFVGHLKYTGRQIEFRSSDPLT